MNLPKRLSFPILIYFIALSLVGLCLVPWLLIKLVPSRTTSQLSVSYTMDGQSPRVIESNVTAQLEAMLCRISGISSIQSTTGNGNGRITIYLDKKANMDAIRFEVSTAIRQLWPLLPDGVSYPQIHVGYSDSRATSPLITYIVNGPGTSYSILQYVDTHIHPQLARLEGISTVNISGATAMEWQLEYDKDVLDKYGLIPDDISKAISARLGNRFLGMTTQADTMYCAVYAKSSLGNGEDLANIAVKRIGGKIVRVGELARITHQEEEPHSYYRINGQNTVYMSIYANAQANQIKLSQEIRRKVESLEQTFPKGYELQLISDSSENIKKEITDVVVRSAIALLILLLFVYLIHRNLKYLTVIMLSVGANITVSFIFYYWLGIEIQIYSIAGITISLGLIIDNILIMADHLLHRGKMNIFLAILASTLTTIASLAVVVFLDQKTQLNLWDFARVLIINLAVSLMVALLLVPALFYNTHFTIKKREQSVRLMRNVVRFNTFYSRFIILLCSQKKWCYAVLLLSFGIPTFLIPTSMKGKDTLATVYTTVMSSGACKVVRSYLDPVIGGSLRLFMRRSSSEHRGIERDIPTLTIQATLPNGCTLEEMNRTVKKVERHIMQYGGVEKFETSIYSSQSASIHVTFTPEGIATGVPRKMRDAIVAQVVRIGNATWSVRGVDKNFDNNVTMNGRNNAIKLSGYNYDELMYYATWISKRLNEHPRIQRLLIMPNNYYSARDYEEYIFETSAEQLAVNDLSISQLGQTVQGILPQSMKAGMLISENNGNEPIKLRPTTLQTTEVWDLKNSLQQKESNMFRIGEVANVARRQIPRDIVKENQQYLLYIIYDFVGNGALNHAVVSEVVEECSKYLPMGYKIEDVHYYSYDEPRKYTEFWIIVTIVLIIYIICCVLYNSFTLPLLVIAIIPISYIGIFLSFTIFHIPMNQGGFAAFILLSGLTCNSVIYILNDYISLRNEHRGDSLRTYIKAFNGKIIPVFLTILSTALGFIPFMFDAHIDSFWMALSVGTICGLFFSIVGIFIFLPLMLGVSGNNRYV